MIRGRMGSMLDTPAMEQKPSAKWVVVETCV